MFYVFEFICYTIVYRVQSTIGVELTEERKNGQNKRQKSYFSLSWQQIALHKQSSRVLDNTACLTLQAGSCESEKENHQDPSGENALFFFIPVPTNHPIPSMLLSYGRCPSRCRHIGRNAKGRFHTNMGTFCRNTEDHTHIATLQSPF